MTVKVPTAPRQLLPAEAVAFRVGRFLGGINARVLLGVIHVLVITPITTLRRAIFGDPLVDPRPPDGDGTWRPLTHDPDDTSSYDRLHR